jgi:hypothetical protein
MRPATAPLLKRRRHVWGLLAAGLLIGAIIALVWAGRANPGADLLGYPYPAGGPDADDTKQKLLMAILAMLAVCGLFGVVAWLADLHSARMFRGGRRQSKRELGGRTDHGAS